MFAAILVATVIQLPLGPSLPPGVNPDVNRAFNLVEEELAEGRFDQAKSKLRLLPDLTITFSWNDQKVPAGSKKEWLEIREQAFKAVANRLPGLKFKLDPKPAIKFSFEKSLAVDPEFGLPRGIALFFSDSVTEPRLEAVIGMNRGNPIELTSNVSLHNEIVYAIGSYLGLAQGPYLGTMMGRVDLQMHTLSRPDIGELGAVTAINRAALQLRDAVEKKKKLEPAKPKADFSPTIIERGPVIQGTPLVFSVQVSNTGNAPVQFRIVPDCGCVTAGATPPIPPGSSVAIPLHVDTSEILGELNRHVLLISNDIEQPIRKFPIKVRTTPRYRFLSKEPTILIVDDKGLDTDLFLVSPKEQPLTITSVEVTGNPGTATFEPWQGELPDPSLNEASRARSGYRIKLHLDEPLVSGRSAATIVVKTTDPKYGVVRHTLFAQRGIAAMPASLFFGDLGTGEREASLILTRPNKPFKVLKIESDSSFVSGTATLTRENWEYKIICHYNGKAPLGDFRATLTIHTDDPKQSKIRISATGIVK